MPACRRPAHTTGKMRPSATPGQDRRDQLLGGDLLALEVLLDERVVGLGHHVDELLARRLGRVGEVVRDRRRWSPCGLAGVGGGRHRDQVDHPAEAAPPRRSGSGSPRTPGASSAQRGQRRVEVGALAVEHVDHHGARAARRRRARLQSRSVCTSTPAVALTTISAESTARSADERVALERGLARRVDQVDLHARSTSRWQSDAEMLMPRRCSSSSKSETVVPSATLPEAGGGAGGEEHRLDQARLPAAAVSEHRDVPNLSRVGMRHGLCLSSRCAGWAIVSAPATCGGRPQSATSASAVRRSGTRRTSSSPGTALRRPYASAWSWPM